MSLKTVNDGYYGDETRWFVGIVESVNDPLKQGRVRVRIFGVHSANTSEIPNDALPWAQCVAPITHGGTSGINGTPVGIKPYAQVFGMFLDGKHSQLPLVLGSIPKVEGPNPSVSGGRGLTNPVPGMVQPVSNGQVHNSGTRPVTQYKFEGGSNAEKVYNLLEEAFRTDFKYSNSKELAAGFVGNFMTESGPKINPMAYNSAAGGKGAHGIAQWRGPRYDNLLAFAAAERAELFTNDGGYKMPDLRIQAAFVVHELKSDVGGLRLSKWGPEATTARHAADRVEAYYEVSEFSVAMWKSPERWQKAPFSVRVNSGRDDVGHYGRRLAYAADAFNSFAHKVSSAPVSPPSNAQ